MYLCFSGLFNILGRFLVSRALAFNCVAQDLGYTKASKFGVIILHLVFYALLPTIITWERLRFFETWIFLDKCLSNITYLSTWWLGCLCKYSFSQLFQYICLDLWGSQACSILLVAFSGSFKVHLSFKRKLRNRELLRPGLTSFCGTLPTQNNGVLWRWCCSRLH